jgi:6-phosphogluconolactonase (cycloisomerase 2 family)
MTFNAAGTRAYVIAENSSQVHVFDVDAGGLLLVARAGPSVYTAQDQQYHWSSDVRLTPDERFVYAVNRQPNEVVRFAVQADGSLTRQAATPLGGEVRAFAIEQGGQFLLAGNGNGSVVSYRIAENGDLSQSASLVLARSRRRPK